MEITVAENGNALGTQWGRSPVESRLSGGGCGLVVWCCAVVTVVRHVPGVWCAAEWALLISVAIEVFQLTEIPAVLAGWFPPAKLVLGTSFVAHDLLPYLLGAVLGGIVGRLLVRILPDVRG